MSKTSLPSANLNANAGNGGVSSWPKAILTIAALLLGVVVVLVGGGIFARYQMFDMVRGDVYGFFHQTVGLDKPTALALGFGVGLIVIGVLWKSFWSLLLGRFTGTLLVAAGLGLLGFWGFSKFGTSPMTPDGKVNQNYAIVDGQCAFFDRDTVIDPRTGKKLFPVTAKVLEACVNRKSGKAPKEVDVSNPAKVEWFDRVLGNPSVYFVKRFNGQMAFFDAPGTDPLTGQPLEAVSIEVVKAAMAQGAISIPTVVQAAPLAPSPAPQSADSTAPEVKAQTRATVSSAPKSIPQTTIPALTRDAVLLVGDADSYAQILIERLHREGVMRHAQRLPASVAWPDAGAPNQAALDAARMLGIRSVAVLSLHKDVTTTAELAGFTHAKVNLNTLVFDTQTGRVSQSSESHAEGRAFNPGGAIAQAMAQLGG